MKSTARLERPEEVEVTITLTMPLAAWKLVRRDLVKIGGNISEPARQLSSGIAELVVRTEQTLLGVEPPVAQGAQHVVSGGAPAPQQEVVETGSIQGGQPTPIPQPRRRPVAGAPA